MPASASFFLPDSDFVPLSIVDLLGPIQIDRMWVGAVDFGDTEGHFEIDNVTLESVPEPATALLLLGGLLGLAVRARTVRAAL